MNNLPLIFDEDSRIEDELALVVKEVEAHYTAQGCEFVDINEYLEPIRKVLGDSFADTLGDEFLSQLFNHRAAAFALGYYTARNPEWLIFQAHTTDE